MDRAPEYLPTRTMTDEGDGTDDATGRRPNEEVREPERRSRFERAVPEILRRLVERAIETGVETLTEGPGELKKHLGDLKLPKEAAHLLFDQIDDTKRGVYRVVAKEIRDVLEHMSFADELAEVLTKLSFEINTQIRFVPNPLAKDAADANAAEAQSTASAKAEDTQPAETGKSETGKSEAVGAKSEEPKEPRRKSRFPRPEVVSKVVMRAREFVTGARADTSEDEEP
ncbi:MAG: hypothetical protein EXR75_15770 [Myxococcales bacterium]|nr:hypothetical protein [Myxococcales bacterium]